MIEPIFQPSINRGTSLEGGTRAFLGCKTGPKLGQIRVGIIPHMAQLNVLILHGVRIASDEPASPRRPFRVAHSNIAWGKTSIPEAIAYTSQPLNEEPGETAQVIL